MILINRRVIQNWSPLMGPCSESKLSQLSSDLSLADLPVGKQNLKYLVKCWDMIHNQQDKRLCLSKV